MDMTESGNLAVDTANIRMPTHISALPRGVSASDVFAGTTSTDSSNILDEAAAEAKSHLMKRAATTSNLMASPPPTSADGFDQLFGRVDSWSSTLAHKAASSFDVFFGGNATVVDFNPNSPKPPGPSQPIDVLPSAVAAGHADDARNGFSRCKSKPDTLPNLVIPQHKAADPSDKPENCDSWDSPSAGLVESRMETPSKRLPPQTL